MVLSLTSLDKEGVPHGVGNPDGQHRLQATAAIIARRAVDAVVGVGVGAAVITAIFLVRAREHSEPGVITGPAEGRVEAARRCMRTVN